MLGRCKDTNMTQGSIWKQIVLFAIPLLIGNLFQQLYNTVDSIVVGQYVGKEALAAVGSVGPIINTLVGFFSGLATGAGVVISQYFGARDNEKLSRAVQTTVAIALVCCVICTVLGVVCVSFMLRFMSTPEDVFNEAAAYLRIYFAGVSALLLYNIGAGILRAVGDSRRPLYFLCVSAVVNIVLDLVFVVCFGWGIAGVAWATVISQAVSAVLVFVLLIRSDAPYRVLPRAMCVDGDIIAKILRIGLPSGIQQAVTSFSNVFVQGYVNAFGSSVMAGWSSYGKIDQFVLLPMQSISLSSTTFVGQNLGAGEIGRAKKGIRTSLTISIGTTLCLTLLLNIFARQLIGMFTADGSVLDAGELIVHMMSPFYVFCCINQIFAGALRGAGDSKTPTIIMLSSFVLFRQVYLYVGTKFFHTLAFVALGYPAGWIVCSTCMLIYFFRSHWEERGILTGRRAVQKES